METTDITLDDGVRAVSLPASAPVTQALILVHGRGASASNILQLTRELSIPATCVTIAPQAPHGTWYPHRFIEPHATNEPALGHALSTLALLCEHLYGRYSLRPENIVLGGFSQGACLIAEFLKRSPKRFKAAAIMSGGLIGTDEEAARDIEGSFDGLPIHLGCDSADPHIPQARVRRSAEYFNEHGAVTHLHLYDSLGHTIHPDALRFIQDHLD